MSCEFGNKIKLQIFGQSHSEAIGAVIDGLPAGEEISLEKICAFLERRAPGKTEYSTKRKERDIPKILSGLVDGVTCGAPLCAVIENTDTRSADYEDLRFVPRPSHADYTSFVKYKGFGDIRGGGHFSGRLTAPLCFAGAAAMQILERRGIFIGSHIAQIGTVRDTSFDPADITKEQLLSASKKDFPVLSDSAGEEMKQLIKSAKEELDSVGGIIECAAIGLPAGLGEPMFDGMENRLSAALFGIPAVKGVEFGEGFACTRMKGSENNDEFYFEKGAVKTKTNHSGGILGGITNGMPLVFRVAVKPTPSIAKEQNSVNLKTGENTKLIIKGRHDPCIVPRALPCVEAAAALVIADFIFGGND